MTQKKKLTPDDLARCVRFVAAIQSACQHERVREYPQVIDGNRFYMRQCEDCGMFNPPASAARDPPQGGEG